MPLLRPKNQRKKRRRPLPPLRHIMCPMNGHQVSWCMMLCTPHDGHGHCGRLAPHNMKGKTQIAIAKFKERRKAG